MSTTLTPTPETVIPVPHVVKGVAIEGGDVEYGPRDGSRFATPKLELDALVWPRTQPVPALHVPVAEVIELLVATGEALRLDRDGTLAQACERNSFTSPYERRIVENSYEDLPRVLTAERIQFQIDQQIGGNELLDSWQKVVRPDGKTAWRRAFPSRLVHILAGNSPGVAAWSVVMGAVTRSVNLFKLPSNDLFTATAVIRALASVAPGHPVTQSFSAAYWRGGDESVESVLFRPQFFDKLVAWGGEGTIRGAGKYVGPGFELVGFDPKTSISMIGHEALESEATIAQVAASSAEDICRFNQETCTSSRFQFIEGPLEAVDRYCELLAGQLGRERRLGSAYGPRLAGELKEEIEVLGTLAPLYRLFGGFDGEGLVIRSDEPVDFHPINKVVNVVRVDSLEDAVRHANVATQTVGVYPSSRKAQLRDALASAGVQRIVAVGGAHGGYAGLPHDGFMPLHRMVRWISDEDTGDDGPDLSVIV